MAAILNDAQTANWNKAVWYSIELTHDKQGFYRFIGLMTTGQAVRCHKNRKPVARPGFLPFPVLSHAEAQRHLDSK